MWAETTCIAFEPEPPQGRLSSFALLFWLPDTEAAAKNSKAIKGGRAMLWKGHGSLSDRVGTAPPPTSQPTLSEQGYEQEHPWIGESLSQ